MPQIETLSGPQDSRLQAEGSLGFPGPALEHFCCHIVIVMDSGSLSLALVQGVRTVSLFLSVLYFFIFHKI